MKKLNFKKSIKISLIVVFSIISIELIVGKTKIYNKDIDAILKTDSYNYLGEAAKEYIKEIYEETGEVILTEKNKDSDKAYLNPDYIEYLNNRNDSNQGYVPNALIYDTYSSNLETSDIGDLPTKYDSRNVDGNNYVTPLKRQYSELCWNYSITSVIESKLLRSGLENDASSLNLSERMIDYATSDPISAIDIEKNPYFGNYIFKSLADSGNEYRYSSALVNGLFPINEEDWEYETDYMGKVSPEDIYDFNKINYQVNEVKYIKDNNYSVGFDEETNKILKQYIIDNGSVGVALRVGSGKNYVAYKASSEDKLNSNEQYNYLYYKDVSAIYQSNDHMTAIIGWNDEYIHNICILDNGELSDATNNNGEYSCNNGELKVIQGVWIIKDSGTSSYKYLAYETVNSTYIAVTDISERDWDNVYSSSNTSAYTQKNSVYTFTKQNNIEKVNSIKFYTIGIIDNLKVYINTNDGSGNKLLTTINTETGGMYTIPIDSDISLSSNEFSISFSDTTKIKSFSVFTNNSSDNISLSIDDAKIVNSFNYQELLDNYQNVIVLNGIGRNINNNIDYVIKNSDGVDVTNSFNIIRNKSVGNYINSIIKFNDDIPFGEYTAYAYINNSLYKTFKINISNYMEVLNGDGTEENPFIITNPVQLDMIRLNKYNFYKLGNDIDLTYDTQNQNGLFYNDGLGWEPISYSTCNKYNTNNLFCSEGFSGGFDGDNHQIIGLYINRPNENAVGLFRNTYNDNFSNLNFKNIVLKNVNITGNDFTGALVGYAYGTTYERNLIIENVSVTGNVKGNDYVGGLIGFFYGGTGINNYFNTNTNCAKRHCLDSLFNSAKVEGNNYVGGIIGLFETQGYYNVNDAKWRSTIVANYWQNNGTIVSNNNASGLIGDIIINNGNIVTLNDSINTGLVKGNSNTAIVNNVTCNNSNDTYPNCSLNFNNIYYTNDISYNDNDLITSNNVKKYNIVDLTNNNIYNNFTNFDNFYKMENINNINRIPILKFVSFEYTSVENININAGKSANIYDYISPKYDAAYNVTFENLTENIISLDSNGKITALTPGTGKIHIVSNYDGYEKDIEVTVLSVEENFISFDSNGGTGGQTDSVSVTYGSIMPSISNVAPIRVGYTFMGWYDNAVYTNGTQYYKSDGTSEKTWDKTNNITLYAGWKANSITCSGGTYLSKSDASCQSCPAGSYCPGGTYIYNGLDQGKEDCEAGNYCPANSNKQSSCPTGYENSSKNSKAIENCYLVTNAGNYVEKEKDQTVTCKAGGYCKGNIRVYYGSVGGRTTCDSGTYNANTGSSSISACSSCAAGSYSLAGASSCTACQTGTTSEVGASSCDVNCSNSSNVLTWETSLWTANTVTNNCKISACVTGYNLSNNICNINKYTVKFDSNGGIGTMSDQEFTYGVYQSLNKNNYTKVGYTFDRWNTKKDGSGTNYTDEEEVNKLTNINDDTITLYAIWTPINYSIRWYNEGQSEYEYHSGNIYDVEYTVIDYDWDLREGYKFEEWNTKTDGSGTSYKKESKFKNLTTVKNSIVNLYAIILPINYKISFNSNGGTGTMNDQEFTYDISKKITKNTYTKNGYNFIGWNTKADGSGTSYTDEEEVKNLKSINDDVITLYAIWEASNITNNSTDYIGVYDENEHTISIDVDIEDYSIKYSNDGITYNLDNIPKYSNVGEYTIYYKITKDGYDDLISNNKIYIYGIKNIDNSITVNNNILVISNNSFNDLKNKIEIFSISNNIKHLDKDDLNVSEDIIKTGDKYSVKINDTKDFTYSIAYLGDVNGDGNIGILDYVRIMNDIMNNTKITGINYLAADVNKNGNIDILDYIRIMNYIMNK